MIPHGTGEGRTRNSDISSESANSNTRMRGIPKRRAVRVRNKIIGFLKLAKIIHLKYCTIQEK